VLLAPGPDHAGPVPTFEWEAVPGAETYRLGILDPTGPFWAWAGPDTSVTLGLQDGERPTGAPGLTLPAGSWWSVTAMDADGRLVGASGLRSVSPDDAPAELQPPSSAASSSPTTGAPSEEDAEAPTACDILTPDEAATVLGSPTDEGVRSGFTRPPADGCEWKTDNGQTLSLTVDPDPDAYEPERWATMAEPNPPEAPGLPSPSYLIDDGLSVRVGWMHGDQTVMLIGYGGAEAPLLALAAALEERL
jgi:hypothetical protein